ncbi:MAG: DUF3611 family protein [Leptolyngbyaceae cyanobacterium SU_3_3]|nr:DUF3611 family protein [Leptolyngbyaceae cyanobacterium SU_3_3]NJR49675.1 DUF3611 family protein [Leptolyngbyaceae cyanobacterium CSU_1_3]
MQSAVEASLNKKLESVGTILRAAGWFGFWLNLVFVAAASLMLMFAIAGRSFNQAVVNPIPGAPINPALPATTPGMGIGIFWAVCSILALLFSVYLAYRQTRFAKRLQHADSVAHPSRTEVAQLLRLGAIVGFIGMLFAVFGGMTTLSILLAKSLSQVQSVSVLDPSRTIRSLDIFVALANMTGITAHLIGTFASASLFEWIHR